MKDVPEFEKQPIISGEEKLIKEKPTVENTGETAETAEKAEKAKEILIKDTQIQAEKDAKALAALRAKINGEDNVEKEGWTPDSDFPPPLPEEKRDPNGSEPPPLPEEINQEKEDKFDYVSHYLDESKIKDKEKAFQRLMEYTGANSEDELKQKLKEKDKEGYNIIEIDLFKPDLLRLENNPSLSFLKKIREAGNVLGYTFFNTPGYESQVEDIISRMKSSGKKKEALEAEKIFEEDKKESENEKEKSEFQKIDDDFASMFKDEEKFKKYIEEQKNLPPDAIVYLYHGLGSGKYEAALDVLNGPSHGIEQHSGPTVSLAPVGQFWKGVGFRYALRRDQIEFEGENNPNAVVRMKKNDFGGEGDGIIIHASGALPIDQFEAEVMRSKFVYPNPEVENKLKEKLDFFAKEREKNVQTI